LTTRSSASAWRSITPRASFATKGDLPDEIRAAYQDKILGGFTQEGREKILIAMMKVNFLKRLESSVDSFRLTLEAHHRQDRRTGEAYHRFRKTSSTKIRISTTIHSHLRTLRILISRERTSPSAVAVASISDI
jgi:hypothetical protein